MDLEFGDFSLHSLGPTNVVLGKNGCGKSHLLKEVDNRLRGRDGVGLVRYISPERAGFLDYEPNVEQSITNNMNWLIDQRRRNQSPNFKQQSAAMYRRLELLTLKEIEREHTQPGYTPRTFDAVIDKINMLLDRVRVERLDVGGFRIVDRENQQLTSTQAISSGESELISLGIEILAFVRECRTDQHNYLLIDEPDVHLHPDLQDRLAQFMMTELSKENISLILATHSTALLSALALRGPTRVAFMRRGDAHLTFREVTDIIQRVLPMFGAHPLSNVFNQAPILLVEGEDDERIWQQAVRSSEQRIKLYPCPADSIDRLGLFETEADQILQSVYDNAVGYSLRDRDEKPEEIADAGHVVRMRLSCRAAENLMLSDDCLALAGLSWDDMQQRVSAFVNESPHHPRYESMLEFAKEFDRKGADLKDIRNVLIGLMTNKPWEVLVGQTIAKVAKEGGSAEEHSLRAYLGSKACNRLLGFQPEAHP